MPLAAVNAPVPPTLVTLIDVVPLRVPEETTSASEAALSPANTLCRLSRAPLPV